MSRCIGNKIIFVKYSQFLERFFDRLKNRGNKIVICVWLDDSGIIYICAVIRRFVRAEYGDNRLVRRGDRAADLYQRNAYYVVGIHADSKGLRTNRKAVPAVCAAAQAALSGRRAGFGSVPLYFDEHKRESFRAGECRYAFGDQRYARAAPA